LREDYSEMVYASGEVFHLMPEALLV
jgi:hypothetical protein